MTQIPDYAPRTFEQRKAEVLDIVAEALLKMWLKEHGVVTRDPMSEPEFWAVKRRCRKKESKDP